MMMSVMGMVMLVKGKGIGIENGDADDDEASRMTLMPHATWPI